MNPMIEFIGVRSSWDMFARNSLFTLLARSASSFAASSAFEYDSRSPMSRRRWSSI